MAVLSMYTTLVLQNLFTTKLRDGSYLPRHTFFLLIMCVVCHTYFVTFYIIVKRYTFFFSSMIAIFINDNGNGN